MRDEKERAEAFAVAKEPMNQDVLENPLFVNSIAKGLRVLVAFGSSSGSMGMGEIARLAELDRSATQRCVFTLKALGFLRQEPDTRNYRLAPKVLDLTAAYFASNSLRKLALPHLEDLSRATEETVNLSELDEMDVVYVARFPSRHVVSVDLSLGARLPAWCTAPGRAILAFSSPEHVARILSRSQFCKRTPNTVTDASALQDLLADARSNGFALADQEAFVGDISLAAPIFDPTGVVAAVNVAVPFPRWTAERARRELGPQIVRAAWRISEALGGRVPMPRPAA